MGVVGVRDRQKVDIFGKKSGGTPNRRVKKLGLTSNPRKFFASAGAVRALADAKNFLGVGRYPQFFDPRVRGTPTFFTEKVGGYPYFLYSRVRGTPTFFTEKVDFSMETQVPLKKFTKKSNSPYNFNSFLFFF